MLTSTKHPQIRRLWLSDLHAFQAHLLRLDHETLHDRFGGYASEAFLGDYAETCLSDGSVVYGYFDGNIIRGAGELRWTVGTATAEAALSVEVGERHKGVGTKLFARVIRAACNRGIVSLSVRCVPSNQAMLGIARKFEAELKFERDEITGRLVSHRLTPLSLWNEYVEDSFGFVDAALDAQKQLLKRFWSMPGLPSA